MFLPPIMDNVPVFHGCFASYFGKIPMFFLVILPPCLGVTFMLLLVMLQWFCLLARDNCQFLVVLLPALGLSITVRDPEPSEKHFRNIINYIFRVMQNVFSPPARSKITLCRFVIVYGQCIFSGDIFWHVLCIQMCCALSCP